MLGLDKYAFDVLLAYGLGIGLLAGIIVLSIIQANRAKQRLDAEEK